MLITIEVVIGKLLMAEWTTWSHEERDALRAFTSAAFARALGDEHTRVRDVVDLLAFVADDIRPSLRAWEEHEGLAPRLALADLIVEVYPALAAGRCILPLASACAKDAPYRVNADRLAGWLTADARRTSLDAAFERWLEHPESERLAHALDRYTWLAL